VRIAKAGGGKAARPLPRNLNFHQPKTEGQMPSWKDKFKWKPNDNLTFIWHDLMNTRARQLALHTIFRVLLGSAFLIAMPYAIGFLIDGMTNQILDALLVGGVLLGSLKVSGIIIGWWRQQSREYFFQEEFWHIPVAISRLYFKRPLALLAGGTSEIDGSGVESLRDKTRNVLDAYIFHIIPGWGSVAFGLIACLYANIWLGLVVLLYIVIERFFGKRDNKHIHKELEPVISDFKRWARGMEAWWGNVNVIKWLGIETKVLGMIHDNVQPALRADDAIWRVYFAKAIAWHRIRDLIYSAMLYSMIVYLVFTESLSLAIAVLVFFSSERISSTLGDLNDQQRNVQFDIGSIAKYRRVLQQPMPFSYDTGKTFNQVGSEKGITITFDKVSHTVSDGESDKLVLRDVNLTILAGQRVGIVGPSGAGKSQLLSLLVRATDPQCGRVLINNTDLREWRLESLLRYYGVIMQKSEPFEDTVLGNLLFPISHFDLPSEGGHSPTDIEAMARDALRKAGLNAEQFPNDLHTNIGYKGLKLSGGQQQRLQIAGAHLKLNWTRERPRLILADEPTASLDSLSELTVMEHLSEQLPMGTTVLMIAHRLSTVAAMDRIVFVRPLALCNDDTVQVTSHRSLAELYDAEALFREMADAQGFRP